MNKTCPDLMKPSTLLRWALPAFVALALPGVSFAQTVESRALTDKIQGGSGVIDLLRNVSGSDLNKYFSQTGKMLLLGVDINEDNSGNESSKSLGVAIKNAQLSISTTAGDFTFKDFFTSTSSILKETGSTAAAGYSTLFGQGGSSQITGTGSLDISRFDDVMWFENINFTGDITSAKLTVNLLDTGKDNRQSTSAETFFDFSGGFEDFALFNVADSVLLEEANIGMAGAPADVTFASGGTVVEAIAEATATQGTGGAGTTDGAGTGDTGGGAGLGGGTDIIDSTLSTTPAAPAPPFLIALVAGALLLWKQRKPSVLQNA